jgi:anaerobic C4-dicarboxylate transporter
MGLTLQLILVLACLFYGARKGGIALALLIGVTGSCVVGYSLLRGIL